MTDKRCKCLDCSQRFNCDFALSAWAAKARMLARGIHVAFVTVDCGRVYDD